MGRSRRRQLGQNFLVDQRFADAIADLARPRPDRILEIGPGRGALTAPLLQRFPRVLALELDERLIPPLQTTFAERDLEIRLGDALTVDLDRLLADEAPWQVAANLPYSVGTAILRRILPRHDLVSRVVVMLQKEVVTRLLAEPAGSGHGLLALERAAYADARLAFDVPAGAFRPRPKVDSAVAVVDLRPADFTAAELRAAFRLAAHGLNHARKTLANAVKPLAGVAAIADAAIDPGARPGTLTLADWVRLAASVGNP